MMQHLTVTKECYLTLHVNKQPMYLMRLLKDINVKPLVIVMALEFVVHLDGVRI